MVVALIIVVAGTADIAAVDVIIIVVAATAIGVRICSWNDDVRVSPRVEKRLLRERLHV